MRKHINGFKNKERAKLYELQNKCNGKQIFGNNEWYDEWGEYLISKGIKISDEGLYKGELDDLWKL